MHFRMVSLKAERLGYLSIDSHPSLIGDVNTHNSRDRLTRLPGIARSRSRKLRAAVVVVEGSCNHKTYSWQLELKLVVIQDYVLWLPIVWQHQRTSR